MTAALRTGRDGRIVHEPDGMARGPALVLAPGRCLAPTAFFFQFYSVKDNACPSHVISMPSTEP